MRKTDMSTRQQKSDLARLDKNFAPVEVANDLKWYDIRDLGLEGQGWRDTESPYDRLPARAKSIVRPPVWELSQHSAGLCARHVVRDRPGGSRHAWHLTATPVNFYQVQSAPPRPPTSSRSCGTSA